MLIFFLGLTALISAIWYISWDIRRKSNVQVMGKSIENTPTTSPPSQAPPKAKGKNPISSFLRWLLGIAKWLLGIGFVYMILVFLLNFGIGFIQGVSNSFGISDMLREPDRTAELDYNHKLPTYGIYETTNQGQTVVTVVAPPDAKIVVDQDGQGGIRQVWIEDGRIKTELTDNQRGWFANKFQQVESIRPLESIVMLHTDRKEQSLVIVLPYGQWKATTGEELRQFYYTDQTTLYEGLNTANTINSALALWDQQQMLMQMSVNPAYLTSPFGIALQEESGVHTFFTGDPATDVSNFFGRLPAGEVTFGLPIEWEDSVKRSQSFGGTENLDGAIGFEIIFANP